MSEALKERFREKLHALGFSEVRFAPVGEATPEAASRFHRWLAEDQHADMHWLAKNPERRMDPRKVLETTSSVVVVGAQYQESPFANHQPTPVIARYARYTDYHETIGKPLREACHWLEKQLHLPPRSLRAYTDTGPVFERGWAARAGLGFQGKNGMLISRQHGNWLILGVFLIPYPFSPDPLPDRLREPGEDPPLAEYCGTCTRCLTACPTGAIKEPGLVDARLCLSYQTIENRGSIPLELRRPMGYRLFGCDDCLEVCPWNKFAQKGHSRLLEARPLITSLGLLGFLRLDRDTYVQLFRKSPLKRAKLEGLWRNAAVVAGNFLRHEPHHPDVPAIKEALAQLAQTPNEMVAEHARWALAQEG
ncbi:MAG: tRNA epoxyqueuosine(34) reductase QueG [Opitutales bacterium]|nr:tRNA epoxyqueuosine(34) reductase QueG [Opitutales bacterium]MCH8540631.1 tRNA epoxyqueuosine(34) reductase QueG [Opitutales bacterium]